MSWNDIPTCKESGVNVDYLMLRGIFMSPGAKPDQVEYYVNLLKKVRETPDWNDFMEKGAFNQTFMTGGDYRKWVESNEKLHADLMKAAGFLAKTN
jgi:putative tricarboxylic transport membrane protein